MADAEICETTEIWKPVPGYEGLYEASSLGRVRSLGRQFSYSRKTAKGGAVEVVTTIPPRVLKCDPQRGYLNAKLYDSEGRRMNTGVHRLICAAFNGPCPEGYQAAHLNGSRSDNRPENIIWATASENCSHRVRHGTAVRGDRTPNSKMTNERVRAARLLAAAGWSAKRIGELFGVSGPTVQGVTSGRSWAHIPDIGGDHER